MPTYEHDCDDCRFLGAHKVDGQTLDLYVCEDGFMGNSLIARFGSEGPEYSSLPVDLIGRAKLPKTHALVECLRRYNKVAK